MRYGDILTRFLRLLWVSLHAYVSGESFLNQIVAHSQFDPFRENAAAAKKPLSHFHNDLIEWCEL